MSEEHHVHFMEEDDSMKNNDIVIKRKNEKKIEIQLGFLQINHVYQLSINLLNFWKVSDVTFEQKDEPVPNINCRLLSYRMNNNQEDIEMKFSFTALKEKLVREKIQLQDRNDFSIELEFVARVLGKGKGTPMLRSGIKCVNVLQDADDTEASDWQGFD